MKRVLDRLSRKKSPQFGRGQQLENEHDHPKQNDHPATLPRPLIPRTGQHGLVLVNAKHLQQSDAEDNTTVDIVAIHGLGGDIRGTWTHQKSGTFWLQDLLPGSISQARIFSYGYPSDIFLSRSTGQVRHYARNLLSSLQTLQEQDTKSRPVIYICHSLGGIVFKQAMNVAFEKYYEVWERSKGVIFLGTPHRGSTPADLAALLGDIANAVLSAPGPHLLGGGVSTSLLRTLKANSEELNGISDVFTQRAGALAIETFFETYTTSPIGDVIVTETSALLGVSHERCTPLYANHRELCRFENHDSENYKLVLGGMLRLVKEAVKDHKTSPSSVGTGRSLDQAEKHCLYVLNTTDVVAYEARLDQRAVGTLEWVRDCPEYSTWLIDEGKKLLFVTGDAGCGKTVLSTYILRCLTEKQPPRGLVCRFFCSGQIEAYQEPSGLIRSIIYQIVRHRRRLLRLIRRASDLQGSHLFDRFDALWDIFVEILQHETLGSVKIIIDGIDECREMVQKSILDRVVDLLQSSSHLPVKFLFTSRPNSPAMYAITRLTNYVLWNLEAKQSAIAQDVSLVIRQKVDEMVRIGKCEPHTQSVLEKTLTTRADCTFLWVSVVLPVLEQRRYLDPADIVSLVRQLPDNLAKLYRTLLDSIPSADRRLAGKLLRLIVASARPFDIDEIRLLTAIRPSHSTTFTGDTESVVSRLKSIRVVLGPLIRTLDAKVYLVHQSLGDYLIDLSSQPSDPLWEYFGVNREHETFMLVQSCVRYLALDNFAEDLFNTSLVLDSGSLDSPISQRQIHDQDDDFETFSFDNFAENMFKERNVLDAERCALISQCYPLFDYAAKHWAMQLARCDKISQNDIRNEVVSLCKVKTNHLSNWFRYFWISSVPTEPYPTIIDSLVIAAFFGIDHLLGSLLAAYHDGPQAHLGAAVYWAARRGHAVCLQQLFDICRIEVESCYVNRQSPLLAACEYGNLHCVEAIVSRGWFDVNEQDHRDRTPLTLATLLGFNDIIQLLLKQPGVDVNRADLRGETALFSAVASTSRRTVPILLEDHRTNPNHLDHLGRNALFWAVLEGHHLSAKTLLQDSRVEVDLIDHGGRTALSYAAQNGHLSSVQLLVRSGRIDPSRMDKQRRNAVSWAAQQPQSSVLHYLIKHDPKGADKEDINGWTPLAWALNPPGYSENVSVLIQSDLVNVNHKDEFGRSALSYAAEYGLTVIMNILTRSKDIDINNRDNFGRTPLLYAAAAGNLEAAQLLVRSQAPDINAQDDTGRTALSLAAGEGQTEVVKWLLSIDGTDALSTDKNGRTAFDFARLFDKSDVLELLR